MSKTKPEIAKAILERRNRMTHVILPGEITAEIGPDGVSEALKERWLVPDADSGYLCATNDLAKVEEMRKLADMKPEQYQPEAISVTESHDSVLMHTRRRSITEIAAPATGKPDPAAAPAAPAAPAPTVSQAAPAQGQPGIGSAVTVARNGVSATGMIEKLLPDGRYKVGFAAGQQQRPPGDDIYSKDEVTVVPGAPK